MLGVLAPQLALQLCPLVEVHPHQLPVDMKGERGWGGARQTGSKERGEGPWYCKCMP